MKRYELTIGDVFPADDPVARWLVTISVGLNDVLFANKKYAAGDRDFENLYFFRLASTHLWELSKFISQTHGAWEEVQQFVDGLTEGGREHFEAIKQIATTGDLSTVGTELVQIRDLFGHYQEMDSQERDRARDPLAKALGELAAETGDIELGEVVAELRLGYADGVVAQTVMRLMPEEADQERVLGNLAEGVGHVLQFVQLAVDAWLEPRMEMLREVDAAGE
ncbi:MAG TPA: hypothetical protein VNJ54_01250 [Plantibacter sp.]|uniref:hypothetical protein n=1 Tax=Plantibacter sp. TaxID=1871045 RepID=UPI002B64CBED|nr:hypothetical protein [Plantibacter sp.]